MKVKIRENVIIAGLSFPRFPCIFIIWTWTKDTRQSTEDKNFVNELKLLQKQTCTKLQKQISECYLKPLTVTRLQQTRCPEVCRILGEVFSFSICSHGLSQMNNFASNFFGGRHSQFSFSINKHEMSTIFLGWLWFLAIFAEPSPNEKNGRITRNLNTRPRCILVDRESTWRRQHCWYVG